MSYLTQFDISGVVVPIQTLTGDAGGAISPVAGNINLLGGNVLTSTGAGNTIIFDLDNGTNGQVLIGGGADPAWATITSADATVTFAVGANTLDLSVVAVALDFVTDVGTATEAANTIDILGGTNINTVGAAAVVTINLDAAITLATSVTSPLYTVASGDLVLNMADDAGIDTVSFTNDSDAEVAFIDSLGAASFTELDVDNITIDGNTIISADTDGDITLTPDGSGNVNISYLTQYTLPIAGASGAIGDLVDGLGSSGEVLTSNGVGAEATWQAAAGGGLTWAVTTVNASIVVNNGYIADKVGLLTMTLPASGAIGDIIELTNINTAVGWRIAQNALQAIRFGNLLTTIGVGGYLEATVLGDSLRLVCTVSGTSTRWLVLSSLGNITVV